MNGNLFPSILWMLGIMVLHVLLLFSWLYTQTHTEPWGIDDAEEKQQPTDMSGLATSSHRFCIIGVRLRFPYCLMCEQQPEATRTMCRVCLCVCVWILYVTYLTSAVAMLVKEVHIKQTCADRRTSKYSHKWTPIAILKDTQHYIVLHKLWCFLHRYEHTDVNLLHLSGALEPLWIMWYNTLGLKCYKSWCTCHLFLHHCLLMVKTLIVGMALRKLWVSSPKCTTLIYH